MEVIQKMGIFHKYPYKSMSETNLDYILDIVNDTMGLHLVVSDNRLKLVNANDEVVSNVTISYATSALKDDDGNEITAYILGASAIGNYLVLTKGDGTTTSVTIPFATKAETDVNGIDIVDYIKGVSVSGNNIVFTHGDGTTSEVTAPYAVKANKDSDGNIINTYACELTVDNDKITLRDRAGRVLNSITVPYATESGHAETADEATTAETADEATTAETAEHSTNSIESIEIDGNTIVFTTYGGDEFVITSPYSVKANKDDLGNVIKTTYVANVTNDTSTGAISFIDAMGNTLVTITPTVTKATKDSYNNTIADYVKAIVTSSGSEYVTITHGTGNTDTIKIKYSDTAWKDTNGNVIKNTYIKRLACVEDDDTGHYNLVAYNGDNPEAELFRIEIMSYYAQESGHAETADEATHAETADEATHAETADEATHADEADHATTADVANNVPTTYVKELTNEDSDQRLPHTVWRNANNQLHYAYMNYCKIAPESVVYPYNLSNFGVGTSKDYFVYETSRQYETKFGEFNSAFCVYVDWNINHDWSSFDEVLYVFHTLANNTCHAQVIDNVTGEIKLFKFVRDNTDRTKVTITRVS